tara:strand:- start:60 stop:590 length:531 start_codon:yes stop_codon:yes gene_type:complete
MKLLIIKFISIFIYLIPTNPSYAIQQPDFKNILLYKEPKKVENIAFKNLDNEKVNLKDYKNSLIILNFWATWCKPCIDEMPSLNRLQINNKFKNLKVIPINVGQESKIKSINFFKKLNIDNLEIFFDDSLNLPKKFSLRGLPTSILINKNGQIFARIVGSIDFDDQKFIKWLNQFD